MNKWLLALEDYSLEEPVDLYSLSNVGKNNDVYGVRNGSQDYILKCYSSMVYDDFASIQYENDLLDGLSKSDLSFHVPAPVLTRNGDFVACVDDEYFCLTPKFEGTHPNLSNLDHIEAIGDALGQLQVKLSQREATIRQSRSPFIQFFEFPQPRYDPFALTPSDLGLSNSDSEIVSLLEWWTGDAIQLNAFHKGVYQKLPSQISHNDITPNNVLIHNERVHAVLDFEFMTVSPRAYDLAMALRTTMQTWANPEPWHIIERLLHGYSQHIRLLDIELDALPMLMRLRASMSILWWLGRDQQLERIVSLIQYSRNFVDWLDQHQNQFLSILHEAYNNSAP